MPPSPLEHHTQYEEGDEMWGHLLGQDDKVRTYQVVNTLDVASSGVSVHVDGYWRLDF